MDNIKKIKRTAQVAAILSKYGFETLVTQTDIKKLIPDAYIGHSEKRKETFSLSIYERIRMVLEELGPAYIKLGQLMSNRDDLLPEELTIELQKLQDQVQVKDIDIYETLKEELSLEPDGIFEFIDTDPIAAASLSQVYTAGLKEGQRKVVIKVKRKGIREKIEADILIMKDLARIFEKYYDAARKVGLYNIVCTFEKSVIAELSFTQELANIEKFRNNFKGNDAIYIPLTYKELSNSNILCMEFIEGIKISDKETILQSGLDMKLIAETVVDLYLKQIIDYGFFHADPHSGNIFVLPTGQIAFIDYGSVGKMLPKDKEYLGDFVIYALRKDVKRLIRVIKKVAVKYSIKNETQLERDLYELLYIMDNVSVKELNLAELAKTVSKLLNENQTILPEYIYLLVRGIILLEGIGRELGIDTNIIENVKPYGIKLMKQRFTPKHLTNKVLDKLYDMGDRLEELPEDIHTLVQKVNNNELEITHKLRGLNDIRNTISHLVVAMIISASTIGSAILVLADMPPTAWGVSILGFLGFVVSGIMGVVIVLSILRNKRSD
ncbi:AarF/ABC1/UbiB kinase family protein [Dysgonomonas sp. GY75]|uniref:ABC1 kinase family protein n=1 Tax=Dysgonomonas sp. GY75 TaxID=2780419 RepID=UPI001883B66A|nr:AarF/UbiB family protein [Dysgonomonas sp. GY75]MBF0649474.1 AarF/ABC1/UbiB kinase family protein [Dysgonomonas sp. GY75]